MKTHGLILMTALVLAGSAAAQDAPNTGISRVTLGKDIGFSLPEGWRIDKQTRRSVYAICETEACKRTQETCRFSVASAPSEETDDAASLTALHDEPTTRYFRMRAVRIATSKDAEFRRMLAPMTIGARDWAVVETDARHNMKSGLFAETFIGGYKVSATCKTCETGKIRHRDAMAMLESFGQE